MDARIVPLFPEMRPFSESRKETLRRSCSTPMERSSQALPSYCQIAPAGPTATSDPLLVRAMPETSICAGIETSSQAPPPSFISRTVPSPPATARAPKAESEAIRSELAGESKDCQVTPPSPLLSIVPLVPKAQSMSTWASAVSRSDSVPLSTSSHPLLNDCAAALLVASMSARRARDTTHSTRLGTARYRSWWALADISLR